MGFFSSATHLKDGQHNDSIPFEEDYIRRSTRSPSRGNEYQNDIFVKHFNKIEKIIEEPEKAVPVKRQRFRFRDLFRRKAIEIDDQTTTGMNSNKENITPPLTDDYFDADENFTCHDISIGKSVGENILANNNFQVSLDDNSSLQASIFADPPKRRKTFKQYFKKANPNISDFSFDSINSKPLSIRQRLFGSGKNKELEDDLPLSQFNCTSSFYEIEETLTQRYMANNYETLMDDVESIPFDISVVSESSRLHQKFNQVLQSLSPKKIPRSTEIERIPSLNFKSQQEVVIFTEEVNNNPYDIAKKVREIDALTLDSNGDDTETSMKIEIKAKRRPGRISTFVRRLTLRRAKAPETSFISDQETLEKVNTTLRQSNHNPVLNNLVSDLFPEFLLKNNNGLNNKASSETVIEENFRNFEADIPINNFSGSTNVGTPEAKSFLNDADSFCNKKEHKFAKEQTQSGNFNFYHEITALPIQHLQNDENITKDILPKEYMSKEESIAKDKIKKMGSLRRTNSSRTFCNPFDPSLANGSIRLNNFKKNSRPHTSGDLELKREINVSNDNKMLNWDLNSLKIESKRDDEEVQQQKQLDDFRDLINKSKSRQNQNYSSG